MSTVTLLNMQFFLQRLQRAFVGGRIKANVPDLPSEIVALLEKCGAVAESTAFPGRLSVVLPVTAWPEAARQFAANLLAEIDTEPLQELNRQLKIFTTAGEQVLDAESMQRERQSIDELLHAEEQRMARPGQGARQPAGNNRMQLRELMNEAEIRVASILESASTLAKHAADLQAWQLIAAVVSTSLQGATARSKQAIWNSQSLAQLQAHLAAARAVLNRIGVAYRCNASTTNFNTIKAAADELIQRRCQPLTAQIERFRNLPAVEARICLDRILAVLGDNKIASLGVSSGFIGALAYAISLRDLSDRRLAAAGLITAADIADFATRLFIPLALLIMIFVLLVTTWVVALDTDQRRTLKYSASVAPLMLFAFALIWFLYTWLGSETSHAVTLSLGTIVGAVILVVGALGWVGRKTGVMSDDKLQLFILGTLRFLSQPLGLLLVFAIIVWMLMSSRGASALFAKPLSSAIPAVVVAAATGAPTPPDDPFHVLESSNFDVPIRIGPRYSRLNKVWVVQRAYAPDNEEWFALAEASVACVRPPTGEERRRGARLSNVCTKAPAAPAISFPHNTIAAYSISNWHCRPESFLERTAATMTFENNEATLSAILQVDSTVISNSGLADFAYHQPQPFEPQQFLDSLAAEPDSVLVVLGFANNRGDAVRNLALSKERAEQLKNALLDPSALGPEWEPRVRLRGLGDNVLSGLFGLQDNPFERRAVAFICKRGSNPSSPPLVS